MDKMKKILKSPLTARKHHEKIFGVSIQELVRRLPDGIVVPAMFQRVCNFILENGMDCEGIFRVNGNAKYVEKIKESFDKTGDANLKEIDDVYAVAGALKLFLRELPEGLISAKVTKDFIRVQDTYMRDSTTCLRKLKVLLQSLPDDNYILLKYLAKFLVLVTQKEYANKMSPIALGIVFGPNIFRCSEGLDGLREQGITNQIACKFIVEYDTLFKGENELSPYNARSEQDVRALLTSGVVSAKQYPKPHQPYICDVDIISQASDESCDSRAPTPRTRPSPSATRIIEDEYSRSSSPFLLSVESDVDSTAPSPRISMSSNEMVDRVIRATVSERIFGDAASSSDDARSDLGAGGPVPAPRKKRNKERKSYGGSPRDDPDNISDISIIVPSYGDSDSLNGPDSDSTVSSVTSTPVPKPRSPKFRKAKNSPQRNTEDSPDRGFVLDDQDFDRVERTELLTGFKRVSGPKNRRSPSKTNSFAAGPRGGWLNGILPNPSRADKYKTYPPRCVRDNEMSINDDEVKTHNMYYSANKPEDNASSNTHLEFLDIRQNGTKDKSPDLSPNSSRKPYIPPLDLSILHEHGDGTEPIRAEEGPSLVIYKERGLSDDEVLLSPRAVRLKKKSANPDTNVPPSPPLDQSSLSSTSVKQEEEYTTMIRRLTKKIQALKRKIKQFEEKFEQEQGYRPSQSIKAADPDMKTVMDELSKARKELKGTKEEYRGSTERLSEPYSGSRRSSIDEEEIPDMHYTLEVINRRLREKRSDAGRPEDLNEMDSAQVQEEKLAIQKALLYFESLHGRPSMKEEKELMRPLYDRYRNIKRVIASPKVTMDTSRELQPLPEDQPVEFSPSSLKSTNRDAIKIPTAENDEDEFAFDLIVTGDFNLMATNFANGTNDKGMPLRGRLKNAHTEAGLHEMDMPQLLDEQVRARAEKHKLRRVLKEYENEFFDKTGKKVQKEDRTPREAEYMAYKQVKAKLRLLDALISKRDPTSSL